MNSQTPIDMHGIEVHIGDLIRRPLLDTQEEKDAIWTVTHIRLERSLNGHEYALTISYKGVKCVISNRVAAHKIEVILEDPKLFVKKLPV